MFILCYISSGLEYWWSVNHTSIYENSLLKPYFNNEPNDLLGITVYKTLESSW